MSDGLLQKRSIPEVSLPEKTEGPVEKHERPTVTPAEQSKTEKRKTEGSPTVAPTTQPARSQKKSPLRQEIENVLEEGLLPMYKELTTRQRLQFKQRGEQTADLIEKVLQKAKVTIIELIRLIRRWLQLLPVNVFFLEQEAKIKAEKIMELKGKNETYSRR